MELMPGRISRRKQRKNAPRTVGSLLFDSVDNWSFAQSFFFAVTVVTTIG